MRESKPILLVEGANATGPTTQTALDELGIRHGVVAVSSADEALAYLKEGGTPEPAVILVDGSGGQIDVLELVKALKRDEDLKKIPVITLTGSGDSRIINESFGLGGAGYVVKPSDHEEFVEVMRTIYRYWTLSRVPSDVDAF
jgi:CheY-like chemotaxis protein